MLVKGGPDINHINQSLYHCPFVWGIHGWQIVLRTRGHLWGRCFQVMTSPWNVSASNRVYVRDSGTSMLIKRNLRMAKCLTLQPYVCKIHYSDVIMDAVLCQITSLTINYSTVSSGSDQRKHQSPASLAYVRRTHRWPVNSPHKWPVTRKMFPFDDVIMKNVLDHIYQRLNVLDHIYSRFVINQYDL